MNMISPEKREKALEMLASGMSVRAVAAAVGVHKNTITALRPKVIEMPGCADLRMEGKGAPDFLGLLIHAASRAQKPSRGKGDDEFAEMNLTKSQRQYLRLKASGHFLKNSCKDCGDPCVNQRCYNCWRRTAALKRLAKQFPEDSEEYAAGLMEIFQTSYTHPSRK